MRYYCERLDPGFWAEPAGALSNLFFIIAALLAYRALMRTPTAPKTPVLLLSINLFIIGIGSFLWHTVPTPWTGAADVLPIFVFMLLYAFLFTRYVVGWPFAKAALFVLSYLLFIILFGLLVDLTALRGTLGYAPALIYMVFMALLIRTHPLFKRFLAATGLFLLSMTFRAIDLPLCGYIPIGTHWLWHLCNATLLYLLITVIIDHRKETA